MMVISNKQKKTFSLGDQIKKVIGMRILLCAILFIILIAGLTTYDLSISIKSLKANINEQVKPLEDFTISQLLINNSQAIDVKLASFNQTHPSIHVEWVANNNPDAQRITWKFPFSWNYNYQLGEIEDYQFGYFKITGSLFLDSELVNDLLLRFGLLILFILIIIQFLYPLSKKIPEKLFIAPINRFLELVKNPEAERIKHHYNLPIELEELETKILNLLANTKEHERSKALIQIGQLSAQVAHDIRSPLAALEMIIPDLAHLPEEKRIIARNAIGRIRDIANNLLDQYCLEKHTQQITLSCLLTSIIDSLISEKRIQYRSKLNMQIEFTPGNESYGLFANINLAEFKRILSNLINNAVEALGNTGQVIITLEKDYQFALIKIKDNGPGIPDRVLKNLGKRGNTYGKQGGAGLGLSHAIENLKQWQGEMQIESSKQTGTSISIRLPLANSPTWFLQSLELKQDSHILILDDDATIHQIWNDRFEKLNLNSHHIIWHHFSNKNALAEWLSENCNNKKSLIVLCDYEIIDHQENGLDIIESLQLAPYSILVTSRYEQSEVQTRCNQLHIPLLPKSLAMLVPVKIISAPAQENLDLVLLDDDPLVRSMWELAAKMKKKKIATFSHFNELNQALSSIKKDTPIYLDYSLTGDLTGIEIAEKLSLLGYTQLYLATGHEGHIDFLIPMSIKAVVSKDFPF